MGDDRSLIAEVVAVSDVYNYHKGEFIPTDLKVGMKVTIPPMGAQKIKIDNVDYLIMAQNNIPAIIED
jgi:co-chaperonin GroES (HSP10)